MQCLLFSRLDFCHRIINESTANYLMSICHVHTGGSWLWPTDSLALGMGHVYLQSNTLSQAFLTASGVMELRGSLFGSLSHLPGTTEAATQVYHHSPTLPRPDH